MDYQVGFDITVALAGFLGGWVLNNLRYAMKALNDADTLLTVKVQEIEVLVAGEYMKRSDMKDLMAALFAKLDKIENKLDGKADK